MHDPIERLDKLLQGELVAIGGYRHIVPHIRNPHFKAVGQHCYDLHVQNSQKLKRRLLATAGACRDHTSLLHSLSLLVVDVASIFGDQSIKSSLQKKEMDRLEVYAYELTCLDGESLALVRDELIEIQDSICACLKGVEL